MADKPPAGGHPHSSVNFEKSHTSTTSRPSFSLSPFSASFSASPGFTWFRHSSTANNMAPPQSPIAGHHQPTQMKTSISQAKKVDINSLMSPPDPLFDSFNHNTHRKGSDVFKHAASQHHQPLPMSPPVSPYTKALSHISSTPPTNALNDPVLYPIDEGGSPSQAPLFAPAEIEHHRRIVDDHLRARPAGIFSSVSPPRREDYELALTFRSQVMKHYKTNPRSWVRKERAFLEADRRAGAYRYHTIMPAKPLAAKPASRTHPRTDRVSKPQTHTFAAANSPRPIRSNGIGPTPSKRPAARRASPTPEPSRRAVAPNREDKDFDLIADYCPPLDTLNNRPNVLRVEWKGQPIDLGHDAHRHMLHPDEVHLAGALRLDCATYLTSKRRIFERRLQCVKTGKEFRKTDAQQACKIDVNKASKLWMAFDKAGWLRSEWMQRFL